MASNIQFTDTIGAATLANGRPVPADRFSGWTPDSEDIGPRETAVGTGDVNVFVFRTDYFARFSLDNVPDTELDIALRLKRHLERGGSCTVNTGDTSTRVYTAKIRPGSKVSIEPSNLNRRLFRVVLELKNTAAADLLCEY